MQDPRLEPIALAIMNAARTKWGLKPLTDVFQQGVQKEHGELALLQAESVLKTLSGVATDDRNLGYRDAMTPLTCGHPVAALIEVPSRAVTEDMRSQDPQKMKVCGWCLDVTRERECCAELLDEMRDYDLAPRDAMVMAARIIRSMAR